MAREKVVADKIAELVCHQLGYAAFLSVYRLDCGRFMVNVMTAAGQAIAT